MSSTQMSHEHATQIPSTGMVDPKLEVVVIPVSDVDRAKRFYGAWGGGWTAISPTVRTGGGADDTSRLTVLRPLRQGNHDGRAGLSPGT